VTAQHLLEKGRRQLVMLLPGFFRLENDGASLKSVDEVGFLFLPFFGRPDCFQAQPFPVQQIDSPADDLIGYQAGLG
jgi:hypothetical protein